MFKFIKKWYLAIGFIWSIYGIFAMENLCEEELEAKASLMMHVINIIANIFLWPLNIVLTILTTVRPDLWQLMTTASKDFNDQCNEREEQIMK